MSESAGRRRKRSAWTAKVRPYRDKLRGYQDRLERRPQVAFLLQAAWRFKQIEGKHLALVISVNLFRRRDQCLRTAHRQQHSCIMIPSSTFCVQEAAD